MKEQALVLLPEELKKRFKIKCAQEERSMSSVIVDLIEKWLKQK